MTYTPRKLLDALVKHGAIVAPCFIVFKHRAALFLGMARNEPQMNLRLPADLKDQIEDAAASNKRTLTAEVVARLQDSFQPQHEPLNWPDLVELLYAEAKKRGAPINITVG